VYIIIENVERKDLVKLNEILEELAQIRFFEHYKELKDFCEYLAQKYKFDSTTHTIDSATGEIVHINEK
jgi:hypothetical protein